MGYVKSPTREDLMQSGLELWKKGDVRSPIRTLCSRCTDFEECS